MNEMERSMRSSVRWSTGVSSSNRCSIVNGTPISAALNPSAITDTLVLTNVQASDSNSTYFLVVTNAAGSATSSIVHLYVNTPVAATNGEVLKVDFGLGNSPNAQPGFSEMTLLGNPANFNSINVAHAKSANTIR